ncbi:TetR/AcrR family transcriptional regulator [Pseudonocardia lacus]|uniref:TetR/AcrR family transcriptional regulator n=1 Tax=Pseudonocardia lacus TaxID=2835865 RepID=UPI001BDC1832|nr:TetR family transcriptional regulator [Pseudonocardia lacus]
MARIPARERRHQLVAAAFRVIGEEGFAAATTRRVCAEAGAPLAAFHYCFASKAELLSELTAHAMAELETARAGGAVLRPTVVESLRATLRGYWDTVEADPNREAVLTALTQHALGDPSLAGVAQRQYEAYHRTARTTLTEIAEGCGIRWRPPVEQLARMVVVVTDGVTVAWLVDRDSTAALNVLDAFAEQLATLAAPAT